MNIRMYWREKKTNAHAMCDAQQTVFDRLRKGGIGWVCFVVRTCLRAQVARVQLEIYGRRQNGEREGNYAKYGREEEQKGKKKNRQPRLPPLITWNRPAIVKRRLLKNVRCSANWSLPDSSVCVGSLPPATPPQSAQFLLGVSPPPPMLLCLTGSDRDESAILSPSVLGRSPRCSSGFCLPGQGSRASSLLEGLIIGSLCSPFASATHRGTSEGGHQLWILLEWTRKKSQVCSQSIPGRQSEDLSK